MLFNKNELHNSPNENVIADKDEIITLQSLAEIISNLIVQELENLKYEPEATQIEIGAIRPK